MASTKAPVKPKRTAPVVQGSDAWKLLRCGKVTASRAADVLARLRNGGEAAARRDYRIQLVTEILTGQPFDYGFETGDMRWGREQEPFARMAYEELRGCKVEQIPFAQHPTIAQAGASPDGLVGADGLIEIKCPRSYTHLGYILAGVVPEDYVPQMTWQLASMPERKWVDFVSYDSRMPPKFQLFIRRFYRNENSIALLNSEVITFLGECNAMVKSLDTLEPAQLTTSI